MHDYVKLHSVSFSEIDVLWFVMQGWMFLYRGIIFLNSSSDACFIDWHASLLERMWSLVIGQQATSQFEVIFSNSSQDFSCIIISFELCHSNTCLLLMKRYDAPMQIFNAACTEGPPPHPPTRFSPTLTHGIPQFLSSITTNVMRFLGHSRNKVRPALWGCHWLDTSGDTADDDSTASLVEQPRPCRTLEHNSTTSSF